MVQDAITIIRQAVSAIEYKQALLFGSQARGTADADSDYDILIIIDGPATQIEKSTMKRRIRERIANYLIPIDIIIKTCEEVERQKHICGTIVRNALPEAIPL